jgi:hypothetical protein
MLCFYIYIPYSHYTLLCIPTFCLAAWPFVVPVEKAVLAQCILKGAKLGVGYQQVPP